MSIPTFLVTKDPQAILDYAIDWSSALGDDTISASSWTIPAGLSRTLDTYTSTTATVWLAGGLVDTNYAVVNHITTAGGREDERTLLVRVRER